MSERNIYKCFCVAKTLFEREMQHGGEKKDNTKQKTNKKLTKNAPLERRGII